MTTGDRVKERLLILDMNAADASRRAGLERTFVHDLISGRKKSITAEALVQLAAALQCKPEELVGMDTLIQRQSAANVPILGVAETDVWRSSAPGNLGSIPVYARDPENTSAFAARGNGAAILGIIDGTVVITEPSQGPMPGDVLVVKRTRGELREISIRRVQRGEGGAMIFEAPSPETDHIPIIYPSSRDDEAIEILGRVTRAVQLFA